MVIYALAALALAVAAPPAHAPDKGKLDCGEMSCRLFATPGDALAKVLEDKPLILGVGEVHQTNATIAVRSAIGRFTQAMLPRLQHRASDLVAETWISEGGCGEEEKQAVDEIQETTQRPAQTEDELVTLLKKTRALSILPHILEVPCPEYKSMLGKDGELDEERLLTLVTKLLLDKTKTLFERNREHGSQRMVVIYGGAMHNDLQPKEDVAAYSFGKELDTVADGRYIELDLYVPELIAGDEDYAKEPWYPYFEKHASKTKTLLIRVRPQTYLLIFPKSR